ncbi:MAG: GHKL domain-containing protein [Lachnospiraceae bacterium]|jgi:two-component system sensor histidine kinase AgrC|nr:GHKL domain-containing protein [Lachnospiraceae bacterium]
MEVMVRGAGLSLLMGICCQLFFEALFPKRLWRHGWIANLGIPAFTVGFLVIAWTEIPPYILQPIRMTAVLLLTARIFFRAGILKQLAGAVLFVSVYWIWDMLTVSFLYVLPLSWRNTVMVWAEPLSILLQLFAVLALRLWKKAQGENWEGKSWVQFSWLPVLSLSVTMILSSLFTESGQVQGNMLLILALILGMWNICLFWFVKSLLEKEARVQRLELSKEKARNQLELYGSMEKHYIRQRRLQHDYKNQLLCIQGLLKEAQYKEAQEYLLQLTGSLSVYGNVVDTGHPVVNVVLNQKYQEAREKGIAITMAVNDLSGLTLAREDLVTLLVNLLDNAIEACEGLDSGPVIRFKMVQEDGQLILSVRNPVKEPVFVRGKTLQTSKRDKSGHGLGLQNVDEVVRRNKGTSSLKCQDGWFLFSVLFSEPSFFALPPSIPASPVASDRIRE